MLPALYLLFFILLHTMCLHPKLDSKLTTLYDRYENVSLEEFDNCDYVDKVTNVNDNDLVVMQLNIRGIGSKKSHLLDLIDNSIESKRLDVILLSETWLTPFSPSLNIPGYTLHRQDRYHKKGGGVAILVSNKLRCTVIDEINSNLPETECLAVSVSLRNGGSCVFCSMYRPPNSNTQTFLASYNSLLSVIKKKKPTNIIIGLDHNLDLLKSDTHQPTNDFIQNNLDFGLIPTATRPTRITQSTATLIDNIFVSQNLCGKYVSNILINDTSDHLPVMCTLSNLKTTKREPIKITSRDTRLKNMQALKRQLGNHDWSSDLEYQSVSEDMHRVYQTLTDKIDYCIPIKEHCINGKKLRKEPWLTASLKISIDKNKKLYHMMIKGTCSREEYKTYNSTLRRIIRRTKCLYYQDMCHTYRAHSKKLWGLINEIAGKINDKSSIIEYIKIDGIRVYNSTKICNAFGNYFSTVGKNFANKIPKSQKSITDYLKKLQSNSESLFFVPTTEDEILKLVRNLPSKTSCGHDSISNILLKEIIHQVTPVLTDIFNRSLTTGEFPSIMKLAEVIPLYKSKERYYESNYRPISLLSTLSKILEKIVYSRVYEFLDRTGQLYENQYGFRAKHSCEHAIGQVLGNIIKGLENNFYGACVLLDLSKAFDTIEHEILLNKLDLYGIRGIPQAWFKSYLTDRTLRVKCSTLSNSSKTTGNEYPVHYGTPQGSCLGPLIFLIFVNDLHLHLRDAEGIQFADDTTLVFVHRNLNYLQFCIQEELTILQDWFNSNKLTLNIGKSSYLLYHNKKEKPTTVRIELNGIEIPKVHHAKLLGTWLDDQLNWDIHVNKLLSKLKCGIGMLRRSNNFLSVKAKRMLYFGQIHSNLMYCLCIWGTMLSCSQLNKLKQAQSVAIKLIEPRLNVEEIMRKHNILKFEDMITLEQCRLGYKLTHNQLPSKLAKNMIIDHRSKSTQKLHRYETRNKSIPNLPNVSGNKYRSSFLFQSIRHYATVDETVRQIPTLQMFTKQCKKSLLTKYANH